MASSDQSLRRFSGFGGGAVAVHARRARATGRARGVPLLFVRRNRLQCRRARRRPVRDQVGLRSHLHRGARQGNQHGRAQGARRVRRDRDAARVRARILGARIGEERAAVHTAQGHPADHCPQCGGAGLHHQLRRDQLRRGIRRPAVRSAGQGQQERARGIHPQRGREADERRQGDPEAGLARGPAALRGAPRRSANRAAGGRHRVSAGDAAAGRDLR